MCHWWELNQVRELVSGFDWETCNHFLTSAQTVFVANQSDAVTLNNIGTIIRHNVVRTNGTTVALRGVVIADYGTR
jgi:hypothetical protein